MMPDEEDELDEEEEFDEFDEDEEEEGEFDFSRFHYYLSDPCDGCTFLCSIILDGSEYDLWVHHDRGYEPTVFARYGDEDGQNLAGASLGEAIRLSLPDLPEDHQALRIAWLVASDLGLLTEPEAQDIPADTQQPA